MLQQSTLDFIRELEGSKSRAYKDVAGLDTIGVGHLITSGEKSLLSKALSDKEIDELLLSDLKPVEAAIAAQVKIALSQNSFDALASFVFNVGLGAFKKSTLLKKINAGKAAEEITKEFMKWVKAGGKTVTGLQNRRAKEAERYCKVMDKL